MQHIQFNLKNVLEGLKKSKSFEDLESCWQKKKVGVFP